MRRGIGREQQCGEARDGAARSKGARGDSPQVDAHECRRLAIECHGFKAAPGEGALKEIPGATEGIVKVQLPVRVQVWYVPDANESVFAVPELPIATVPSLYAPLSVRPGEETPEVPLIVTVIFPPFFRY